MTVRQSNLRPPGIRAHMESLLQTNKDFYGKFRARIAVQLTHDGIWQNAMCLVQIFPKSHDPAPVNGAIYPKFRLLEHIEDSAALLTFLDQTQKNALIVGETKVDFGTLNGFHQWEFLHSGNRYSNDAGYFYQTGRSDGISVSTDPLIAFDQPYVPNGLHAVKEWLGFRDVSFNDSRAGYLFVFMPELRCGISEATIRDKKLTIRGHALDGMAKDLRVKGAWMVAEEPVAMGADFTPEMSFDVPEGAQALEFYVVGRDATVYDYHLEEKWRLEGRRRILGAVKEKAGLDLGLTLRTGECETIEFKPYVRPGDPKGAEIVETIISFANTRGGTIFVGINNKCGVDGVEQELARVGHKDGGGSETALEEYKGWLRSLVSDKLNKTLVLDIQDVQYAGHRIVAIGVPEGKDPPYAHRESKQIWIRRGANNVIPDPEMELPRLLKKKEADTIGGGLWLGYQR